MTTAATSRPVSRDLSAWRPVLLVGLLFGGGALYVTLVGIVGTFQERNLIQGDDGSIITVGQALVLATAIGAGFAGARRSPDGAANAVIGSGIAGLMSGAALSLLVLLGSVRPAVRSHQLLHLGGGACLGPLQEHLLVVRRSDTGDRADF